MATSLAVGAIFSPVCIAEESSTRFFEAIGLDPSAVWLHQMTDRQMAEERGGYNGIAFNVLMNGTIDAITSTSGESPQGPAQVTQGEGSVSVTTALGNYGGANGFFQIAEINGNMNIIQNTMYVQIAIVPESNLPALQSFFFSPLAP